MKIEFIVDKNCDSDIPETWFRGGLGVYLHGELENQVGYDIPACNIDLYTLDDGIYYCEYQGQPCTLYFWKTGDPQYRRLRGLVVLNTDKESLKFADRRFKSRCEFL